MPEHRRSADEARRTRQVARRRLLMVLCLTTAFLIVETVAAALANSLALLADAGHMLSDVGAMSLGLIALWYGGRPATARRTYGHARAEILAALINGLALAAVAAFLFKEGISRLNQPPEVLGQATFFVGGAGLVVNLIAARMLYARRERSLNEEGVFLHVVSDALGSLGAMLAGATVWATGLYAIDSVVSMLIGALVLRSALRMVRRTLAVLMEATPTGVDTQEVEHAITRTPGVVSVHDLHLWVVSSGFAALSAHVQASGRPSGDVLHDLRSRLRVDFGLDHVTLQVESCEHPDDTACCDVDPRCLPPSVRRQVAASGQQ